MTVTAETAPAVQPEAVQQPPQDASASAEAAQAYAGKEHKRTEPMTWAEAKEILDDGSYEALFKLERNPADQVVYREFRVKLKAEYASLVDYLEITVFGCKAAKAEDGRICSEGLPAEEKAEGAEARLIWRVNDFPYFFEPSMTHHVLWSTKPLPIERLEAEIEKQFPRDGGYESMYFVNPTALQSVTAIWHAHVLVRGGPK